MTVSTGKMNKNKIQTQCKKVWQINIVTKYKTHGVVNVTSPLVLSRNWDDKINEIGQVIFPRWYCWHLS